MECVDVQFERLGNYFVGAYLFKLPQQIFPRLVGTTSGIASSLVLGGTEVFDDPFVMFHVLGIGLNTDYGQQN